MKDEYYFDEYNEGEYKVMIQFGIVSEGKLPSVSELNEIFGVKGDGYKKGDYFYPNDCSQGRHKRLHNSWQWRTESKDSGEDIAKEIECLLEIFEPKITALRPFLIDPASSVFVRIWVDSIDRRTAIMLLPEQMIRLSNICNELYVVGLNVSTCEQSEVLIE